MDIPSSRLGKFAADLIGQCLVSRQDRISKGIAYRSVFLTGEESGDPAVYNKTFAYLDDLDSLLYSPVGLRLLMEFYGSPSPTDKAKGDAVTSDLHARMRQSSTDTVTSDCVLWSLVKGKTCLKQGWDRDALAPRLIQPEMMGVLQENLIKLDENMEAFVHCSYITPYQFQRMIWNFPEARKAEYMRKARKYMRPPRGDDPSTENAMKQIIIGGLYPFQAQGSATPNTSRGLVDWMSGPTPKLAPEVLQQLLRLDELWVWDDKRKDWATFQMVGNDIMLLGEDFVCNALAFNPTSGQSNEHLTGHHPFIEFCPNRMPDYFWGRSEIDNIALLQIAINSRLNGINGMLRRQEDPPKKFTGVSGVNQLVLSRLSRPGGYFSDANPNAKVENMTPEIPEDLFASLHEYERMFDEMGGLPPIAKGRGEAGVRSQAHAETLVRMFSPRFKDRALLVERSVEELGGLSLDLCKAHVGDKMTAWASKELAGIEGGEPNVIMLPPAPGLVPIDFLYSDIPDNARVTVDAHSSSPAFAAEARALVFDLYKIGAMSPEQVVRHVDAPNPEELEAEIRRREIAQAEFIQAHPELAGSAKSKKK